MKRREKGVSYELQNGKKTLRLVQFKIGRRKGQAARTLRDRQGGRVEWKDAPYE